MSKKLSSSTRYTIAMGCVLAATLIRVAMAPIFGSEFPFMPYYLAVIFTTWVAGFAPGILAILLGYIAANILTFLHAAVDIDPVATTGYLALTLAIAWFGKAMHEARWRADIHAVDSRQRLRELEAREGELQEEIEARGKLEHALCVAEERLRKLELELEAANSVAQEKELLRSMGRVALGSGDEIEVLVRLG